jgi:hypothetical protein
MYGCILAYAFVAALAGVMVRWGHYAVDEMRGSSYLEARLRGPFSLKSSGVFEGEKGLW